MDAFSRATVGWQRFTALRSDLVIYALEMAIYSRDGRDFSKVIHQSDHDVQLLSFRYTEQLGEGDIVASVGSGGDRYGNALTESFNSLYKNDFIHRKKSWRIVGHVEWVKSNYVDWSNNR